MGADSRWYSFRHEWLIAAQPDEVFRALADVEHYPDWWRQIRGGHRIDDGVGVLRLRSVLPLTITVRASRAVEDPVTRRLRASLSGDLVGWSQWEITPAGGGTRATFTQEVRAEMRMAGLAGRPGRPVLRWNHAVMMRSGERGLRRYLSAAPEPVRD